MHYEVLIVGGGPAGLSAALILGRCCRKVLLCDDGKPRNTRSQALHGFLSRDGLPPGELLRIGREQLRPLAVEIQDTRVVDARRGEYGFEVVLGDGTSCSCRKLLLATGMVDQIPRIEGIEPLYGRSVFHCPYCDGWEVRGQPLAVYGKGKDAGERALALKTWSPAVMLCTDGAAGLRRDHRDRLARQGIVVREERIARLEGRDGQLERIIFSAGPALPCHALFFSVGQVQRSELPAKLGCTFTRDGAVRTSALESTEVPGLYVAGDASEDLQLAIIAAAEGAKAAFAINMALQEEAQG